MTRRTRLSPPQMLVFSVLLFAAAPAWAAGGVTLVENGRATAALVLEKEAYNYQPQETPKKRAKTPAEPIADERLAAEEIREHLRRISGATIEIVESGAKLDGRTPIRLGAAADNGLDERIRTKGSDPGSFALIVDDRGVSIRGLSPAGTLNGAYELLEQLGVRWFMPGELGLVLPREKTVSVAGQATIQAPSFPARHLQGIMAPPWERRMRLGGPYFPAAHGIAGFHGRESQKLFETHPEYFALIHGNRSARQHCLSNPAVLRRAVEATKAFFRDNPQADMMGIGANDGRGFCQCPQCLALDGGDYDPFGHEQSMTDRYVWFFNQVLKGIEDEFPDKRLGFYAYSVYCRPPVKVQPDRRLVPAIALISLCRLHGMENPVCPEKSYEKWLIQEWGKRVPEVYYRGYWFNLADPGLPFFMIRRLAREVPLGKRLGIAGWRVESPHQWAASTPSHYVAAKLMWDHTADVAALMDDFYKKFFGPAAGPVRQYLETMSAALENADYHTGSSWDMPHVYPAAIRAGARRALDAAASAAPAGPYAKRVAMYARSLDYLDAFAAMLSTRAIHDYAASKRALDVMGRIRDELQANDPPLIGKGADAYMRRFFSQATLQGFERTTEGNRLVAGLTDAWLFQIDPERVGEAIDWWRPEITGGNWQPIKTSTLSWSDQGLRYYKGLAWYRQTVDVPTAFRGQRIFLWCGGIDELAKVWVNGCAIGISPKGAFVPFEMDATAAVRPGQPNTVAFCVSNQVINELGTGGITGPVMFYAPAAGKDAVPRTAKPPAKEFPEY